MKKVNQDDQVGKSKPSDKQFISELVDNQCSTESVDKLLSSPADQKTWFRYHHVSAVLRQEDSVHCSIDFTQAIAQKIAHEPTLVPQQVSHFESDKSSSINPSQANGFGQNTTHYGNNVVPLFRRFGGGLAIAATVAVAMILSVDLIVQNPSNSGSPQFDFADQPLGSPNNSVMSPNQNIEAQSESSNNFGLDSLTVAEQKEQATLDAIQAVLNEQRRVNSAIYEQQVAGEWVVSTVVGADELKKLERDVNNMKKPSEVDTQ